MRQRIILALPKIFLVFIKKFGKVAGYKINIEKYIAFL